MKRRLNLAEEALHEVRRNNSEPPCDGRLLGDSHAHTEMMHMWPLVALLIFGVVNSVLAQAANMKQGWVSMSILPV